VVVHDLFTALAHASPQRVILRVTAGVDADGVTHLVLLPMLATNGQHVGGLAQPATPLPATTTCLRVDEQFQATPTCSGLLVTDPERPGQIGLVSRPQFLQQMAGRFGFGRALLGGAPIADLAQWDPVVIDATATIQQAAAAVLDRPPAGRYDELVVRFPDSTWATLSAAAVLEALSRDLAVMALYDGLTGLANREVLLAELTQQCALTPAVGTALLFLDLDRFKQVNDAHGHNAGDLLLQTVARRLEAAARPHDLPARLGGDEFAVLLTGLPTGPGEPARTAEAVARRLVAAISQPVTIGSHTVLVGASIGVATAAPTGSDPDTLLREADLAMYQAKLAGGGRVHTVASVGCQLESALPTLGIDDTLHRALARDEFVLHYQPIIELRSGTTVSAEALIRWQHPQHGLLPPSAFLAAAGASGLIVELDRWVLTEACEQLVRWDDDPAVTAPQWINVNLSTQHLAHPRLLEHVLGALSANGLAPHRLCLELPETATLPHLQTAAETLTALRAAGVELTLDDLGAGSSTLRHLSDLPLDGVKIDQSFISSMLINERDAAIVRLLIDLAHNLDLKITAEGIETAEQMLALQDLGCSHGQGFHLGRPHPVDGSAVPGWLAAPDTSAHRSTPRT